eukprot:12408439-Karenia_brevis.AAC.1
MSVFSWNSCRKSSSRVGNVAGALRRWLGSGAVGLLQEVAAWHKINGYTYHNYTVLSGEGGECGILLSRELIGSILDSQFCSSWCGVTLPGCIFISAHLLDFDDEDGRVYTVFAETVQYINNMKSRFSDLQFATVIGFDANVTLPANVEGITGTRTLAPSKSCRHSHVQEVLEWLGALGLRALNTYSGIDADNADQERG